MATKPIEANRAWAAALSVLLCVTGCAPYAIKSDSALRAEAKQWVVLDRSIYRHIRLVAAQTSRTDTGLLQLDFQIRNRTNKNLWADVKVEWLNGQHVVLHETNWQPVQFHRRRDTPLRYSAVNPEAEGYRIVVRSRDVMR